jgi:hypothetical protein
MKAKKKNIKEDDVHTQQKGQLKQVQDEEKGQEGVEVDVEAVGPLDVLAGRGVPDQKSIRYVPVETGD